MKTAEDSIRRIFENLEKWRHLPAYRLEPRKDGDVVYLVELKTDYIASEM